jgi:mannosyltransferase
MPTTTPRRTLPWLLQAPAIRDVSAPGWFERLPRRVSTGGVLLLLIAISAVLRTRYFSAQFWSDEAIAVGAASHPLSAIPGILRHEGSTPLYYFVLHIWISVFGSSEVATHALSLLLGMIAIPLAMWTGWSLFGRRAGMIAATLFAASAFFTQYGQETQAYELLALIGLVATASFLHAFVFRRRAHVIVFALALALMLYTSFWAIFFWAGAAVALIPVYRASADRRGVLRDAGAAFGGALVLFAPWLPTLVYQISHDTSPFTYADFAGSTFLGKLLGGDRVLATLAVSAALGMLPLLASDRRRTPEATTVWALLALALAGLLVAALLGLVWSTWVTRYFAALVAPLLLFAAFTSARAGLLGLAAVVISLGFVANVASFSPKYKSDMRDVAGELAPLLRPGDVVLSAAPEQTPLAWYYLPAGLRYATTMGPVADPGAMNWSDAYSRLARADPRRTLDALVATLTPGQHLLVTRPLTEGSAAWKADWSGLVRRRAAQWGALLAADPRLRAIPGAIAPHNYPGACCVAASAIVYTRVG